MGGVCVCVCTCARLRQDLAVLVSTSFAFWKPRGFSSSVHSDHVTGQQGSSISAPTVLSRLFPRPLT